MKVPVLSEKLKNSITKLVDKAFVEQVLTTYLPQYLQDFVRLDSFELKAYKKHISPRNIVFVVEYKIKYYDHSQQLKNISIFCSAHSDNSRWGAYQKCLFLYQHGFGSGPYRVTKPLFFLKEQRAFFYVASPGSSFFDFFTKDSQADLKSSLSLIITWVKKLHDLDSSQFSWPAFAISQMIPSPVRFVSDFYEDSQAHGQAVESLLNRMLALEKIYNQASEQRIIYGDFHPENVVMQKIGATELEMIDFTDVALGDPMVDLGTFLQQLDFMGHKFISREKINAYKEYVISQYFGKDFSQVETAYINRINLYQAWTALRSSILLFYKHDDSNPVVEVLEEASAYLDLAENNLHQISVN